ncbi:MAG: class I SAM-dependent methyltransferase [Thermodesulfobacteriota bacterium]|nr:class I SAM-dependent methyltransferase [Thermodesulfobacteriota bacterium]
MGNGKCPSCHSSRISIFYEKRQVPAHSVLLFPSRNEATNYVKGDIVLGFCQKCGFISNVAFNPDLHEYSEKCEETQGFSPTFNAFSKKLAGRLIEKYDLREKDILEIGCGKGEFLTLLCQMGRNRGVGFDPAYVSERYDSDVKEETTFIKDFYSEKYSHCKADFICCKMTLEHIYETAGFVKMVRSSIENRLDTVVFFQIPEVTRILRDCAFEDIYYEHCSYFSAGSLGRLFRRSDFHVMGLETDYDGQYLMIDAMASDGAPFPPLPVEDDLKELAVLVERFPEKLERKTSRWNDLLRSFHAEGKRAVLWGSGSKAVSFLTTLDIDDEIEFVVDINPYRQGTYMAGTGHEIVSPDFLKEYRPHVVIIMNAVYKDEIGGDLAKMGLTPEILSL